MAGGQEASQYKEMSPPETAADDVEAAAHQQPYDEEDEEEEFVDDPFDIGNTKNAPPESLRRWRVR